MLINIWQQFNWSSASFMLLNGSYCIVTYPPIWPDFSTHNKEVFGRSASITLADLCHVILEERRCSFWMFMPYLVYFQVSNLHHNNKRCQLNNRHGHGHHNCSIKTSSPTYPVEFGRNWRKGYKIHVFPCITLRNFLAANFTQSVSYEVAARANNPVSFASINIKRNPIVHFPFIFIRPQMKFGHPIPAGILFRSRVLSRVPLIGVVVVLCS